MSKEISTQIGLGLLWDEESGLGALGIPWETGSRPGKVSGDTMNLGHKTLET